MGNLTKKLHSPGVMIFRAKGNLTDENVELWRNELTTFISAHRQNGVCGILIDVRDIEGFSIEALDSLLEILVDPDAIVHGIKMRFALVGVKPFTQRFLRETMPIDEVKHVRARFFHEVAENEALAWLQAMISSADTSSDPRPATLPDEGKKPAMPDKPATQIESPALVKPEDKTKSKANEKKGSASEALAALKRSAKLDTSKTGRKTP